MRLSVRAALTPPVFYIFNFISGCRIAAIAADCKSAAFGLRWCKSNHPDHDSVVKRLRQESAKL